MAQRGHWRPAARALGVLTVALSTVVVGSCQSGSGGAPIEANARPEQRAAAAAPIDTSAKITVAPADNMVNVPLDAVVKVSAASGTLTRVKVTSPDGKLRGGLGARKTTWASGMVLEPDSVYRVEAAAVNAEGQSTEVIQTFSTIRPTKVLGTDILPLDGATVGVGQPIQVKFTEPVKDRASVEKRLQVETSQPVEGSWHWFDDKEIRFRPKSYWPAHTQVTLKANLRGVRSGAGAWGIKDKVRKFTIANSVVTKVDLADHHARVYIDGKLARTIPVTGGKAGWRTRNGTKVILEKAENIVFTNEAIGAPENYRLVARWGVRVTWSGEYLHSASWSVGSQGSANTSHGCVGMSTEDSGWLYSVTHVGDPVEVHSPDGNQMEPSNGFGDWNFNWQEWTRGSALS